MQYHSSFRCTPWCSNLYLPKEVTTVIGSSKHLTPHRAVTVSLMVFSVLCGTSPGLLFYTRKFEPLLPGGPLWPRYRSRFQPPRVGV